MWERTAPFNVPTWFSQHRPKFMSKNSFWTIWVISSDLNTDNSLQYFIFHQGEFYQVVAAQANVRKIVFFSEGCFSSASLLCIESTELLSLVHCYEFKVHMFWCFFQQSRTILNFRGKLKNNYMLKCSTHVNPNTKTNVCGHISVWLWKHSPNTWLETFLHPIIYAISQSYGNSEMDTIMQMQVRSLRLHQTSEWGKVYSRWLWLGHNWW